MSNDKMRAEFEKWRDSLPGGTICATPAQAWQAATEVYTDLLQAKDMEIHELKFFIDGEAPLKAIIDAQAAEIARLTSYSTACDGITQDHLDGGWTAVGLSKYAKGLEAEIVRLTSELAQARAAQVEQEPVAWLHDTEGRVDVIHSQVKQLWLKMGQPNGFYRERAPCRVEHYTIPLYAHPQPSALPVVEQEPGCATCDDKGSVGWNPDTWQPCPDCGYPDTQPSTLTVAPFLTVWCGSMPESNGASNFTAVLMRKGKESSLLNSIADGMTIARSEYPERIRYEADCMRFLIGEIAVKPWILDYDADKHSGYLRPVAAPQPSADDARDAARYRWLRECNSGSHVIVELRGNDDELVLTEDDADAAIDQAMKGAK